MLCETPFFISFFERSGSTLLADLLDSHPDISCMREVFYEFRTAGGLARKPEFATREAALEQVERIYSNDARARGFKFKYPTQYQLYPDVYEYLLEKADRLRVIYLYRQNLVKAAISKQNQLRLLQMEKPANLTEKMYIDMGKINLDIDKAIEYMAWRHKNDEIYGQLSNRFKNTFVLTYEALLSDTRAVLLEIFSFLGVDGHDDVSAKTVKVTNDDLRKAVANYDELVRRLTGTEYEQFLTVDSV